MKELKEIFEGHNFRMIKKDDNSIWFCGKDICQILSLKNHNQVLSRLDNENRWVTNCDPSNNIELVFISESGLYNLIFRSRKNTAKRFQKFIFNNVLPEIRQTGSYNSQGLMKAPSYAESLRLLADKIEANEKLLKENNQLKEKNIELSHIEKAYNQLVADGKDKDWTTISKLFEIPRNKFLEFLRNQKILMSGYHQNLPYSKYMQYFSCDLVKKGDKEYTVTRVKSNGINFIYKQVQKYLGVNLNQLPILKNNN